MEPMPGHNRRKGKSGRRASAFKYRPRDWHLAEWMRADEASFRLARLIKLSLGRLPAWLAAFGRADFDLDEDREYGDGPQQAVSGGELAGIAAHIIRSARQGSQDYVLSLKGLPAAIIEPLKIYFRVKLAMGRLEAEVAKAQAADVDRSAPIEPAVLKRSARPKPSPKAYTWHTSPAKTYDFKAVAKTCGYDPRETSAYWIEKRANALRRRWKTYSQMPKGGGTNPRKPKEATAPNPEPVLRHFTPADADYNSVWPPIKLPSGPPKLSPASAPAPTGGEPSCQSSQPRQTHAPVSSPVIPEFSQENIRDLGSDGDAEDYMRFDSADEERPLSAPCPAKTESACEVPDICAANSGMTDLGEARAIASHPVNSGVTRGGAAKPIRKSSTNRENYDNSRD